MSSEQQAPPRAAQATGLPLPLVTDNELGQLKNLDIEISSGTSDNPAHRVVEKLTAQENDPRLSELSNDQVKLLTRISSLGYAFNDDISQRICDNFVKYMISKERKGRSRLEEIAIPKALGEIRGQSLKDRIFSKFGRKQEV